MSSVICFWETMHTRMLVSWHRFGEAKYYNVRLWGSYSSLMIKHYL